MIPAELQEYILNQKESFQKPLSTLSEFIVENFSDLRLKMVYNTPFFYGKKRVLYLTVLGKKVVRLGFCDGAKLHFMGAEFDGVKNEISFIDFQPGRKIELEHLRASIIMAIEFDLMRKS